MTEYLVFPIPIGLVKVKASGVDAAIKKYRKAMPDMEHEEVIIVGSAYGQKTHSDNKVPLYKCSIEKI
jgi:hypothetical protein